MNLIELYDSLSPVEQQSDERRLNAIQIPEFPNFRIGIDIDGNPILLLSAIEFTRTLSLKNIKLKYLQLNHNIECKIFDGERTSFETLSSVTFTSDDRSLQEHFLRISETLVRGLGVNLTQKNLVESLNRFIEVFRALSDTPTKTIHGLWAELFLIDFAANPQMLLYYWHSNPEERFDFNSGVEKIEVKSNSNFERIHMFSSDQLNPPLGTNVIIASVFVRRMKNGQSIQQLVETISSRIQDNDLIYKLNLIVYKTLGNAFDESCTIKFDYSAATTSLEFYRAEDIEKIKQSYIPNQVTNVTFKSDLSRILPVNLTKLRNKGQLFNSL